MRRPFRASLADAIFTMLTALFRPPDLLVLNLVGLPQRTKEQSGRPPSSTTPQQPTRYIDRVQLKTPIKNLR